MSKAFTKEQDDELEEELEEEERALPKGTKNYITPAGYARLQAELEHLLSVERPEVVKVVSWAAGLGDRSENADYIYGKKRLREIDKRIRFLTKRLGFAQVVDPTQQPHDKIYFGATVVVADATGKEATYTIVGIDEIDPARGRISWRSPLALALLGREEGETVTVRTPAGVQELDILEVRYEAVD
ncbi:MAG: transcription elongation factor GreB [Burkholderiales bacterium]